MHGLNEYDFSARWQDAANPGFTTADPLAEMYYSQSPYMYCGGDPVNRVDPTGMNYVENGQVVCTAKNLHNNSNNRGLADAWANSNNFNPNGGQPTMAERAASDYQIGTPQQKSSEPVNTDKEVGAGDVADKNSPTYTRKQTTVSFQNRKIKIERYKTVSLKGNMKGEVVVDDDTNKPESYKSGKLSVGLDGTVTYGDAVSVGVTADGKTVLDISIPILNMSFGTTMYFDTKQMKNDLIRDVNTFLDGCKNIANPSTMGAGSFRLYPYFY